MPHDKSTDDEIIFPRREAGDTAESRYSNRQIERMLMDQSKDLKIFVRQELKPIVEKVKKIGWMEKAIWLAMGALPVLTFLGVYLFIKVDEISDSISHQNTDIQSAVDAAFQDNLLK